MINILYILGPRIVQLRSAMFLISLYIEEQFDILLQFPSMNVYTAPPNSQIMDNAGGIILACTNSVKAL